MDYANNNLKNYYDAKYNQPKSDSEAITTIIKVYQTEMSDYTEKIGAGIGEVYRELLGKGLPSYYWLLEAIHRTSKKAEEKKSFRYIVGTLRNWSLYGFGNTLSDEEEEVFDFFKEVTGVELSNNSRKMINSLMGNYGVLKLMRSISGLKEIDASVIFAEILGRNMIERYSESSEPLIASSSETRNQSRNKNLLSKGDEKQINRKPSEKLKKIVACVEDYLKVNGVSRPSDIARYLQEKGFTNITPRNVTSHLSTIMNNSKKVIKKGTGEYSYVEV